MTVDIQNTSSGSGWSSYVLGRNGERKDATLIKGDTVLADKITEALDYKSGDTVRFVISFDKDDNVTQEQGREIVLEFFEEFMHGFKKEEYLLDVVEHTDTNHLHYHARIPKLNLLTQTQLKLYWHKSDLGFKKAIIDKLADKHGLVTGEQKRRLIPDPQQRVKQINEWRREHGQKPFDLSSKKGRGEAEERLSDYFTEAVKSGFVDNLDEIKAELSALGFTVVKEGFDKGKEFHYLTVQNDSGKLRIKGDIYGAEFYRHSREDRAKAIVNNQSLRAGERSDRPSRSDIDRTLQRERKKRLQFIDKQYSGARKRAYERLHKATNGVKKEQHKDKKLTPQSPSPYRPIDRRDHRNIGNSLLLSQSHRDQPQSDRSGERRHEVVQSKSSRGEVENDRVREQAIKRIRSLRSRQKQERRELQRAKRTVRREHQEVIQFLSVGISRELNEANAERERRAGELSNILENANGTATADYQVIAEATAERGIRREAEQGFTAVIQAVTDRVQQLKRSFDNRAKSLTELFRERVVERAKERTMQELNHFKQNVNIAEYAQLLGYTINKKKSTKISPVLQKDGETIVVGQDRRDNHYIYFNVGDNADSGTIIDFVQRRTGETLGKVRKRLRQWLGMPNPQVERVQVQPAALDEIELSMAKDKAQKLWNSLSQTGVSLFRGELRGIPIDTVKTAKDSVRRDDQGNWYFALRDANGEICGVEKRDKDGRNARIAEAGQKKGIFAFGGQDPELCEKIIVTESTIDALSAKYISEKSTHQTHTFVSIGGNAGIVAQKAIKELCDKLPKAEIIFATDNDQAGDRHAQSLMQIIGKGREYARHRPQNKDLNDDLQQIKVQRMAERQQNNRSLNRGRGGMSR